MSLAFLTLTPVDGATLFLRGDGNLDRSVDLADAATVIQFLAGGTNQCPDALDTNDDGAIDIADPIYNLSLQFSGGPLPPAPYPGAGPDPTEDVLGCG